MALQKKMYMAVAVLKEKKKEKAQKAGKKIYLFAYLAAILKKSNLCDWFNNMTAMFCCAVFFGAVCFC